MTGAEKSCRSAVTGLVAIYSFAMPAPSSKKSRKSHSNWQEEERSHKKHPQGSLMGWVGGLSLGPQSSAAPASQGTCSSSSH